MGAFVGFEFPILLRVFGTYYFSDEQETDSTNLTTVSQKSSKGSGIALGAGYTGLPFLALNVEYRSFNHDESTNYNGDTADLTTDNTFTEIMFSISLPFVL